MICHHIGGSWKICWFDVQKSHCQMKREGSFIAFLRSHIPNSPIYGCISPIWQAVVIYPPGTFSSTAKTKRFNWGCENKRRKVASQGIDYQGIQQRKIDYPAKSTSNVAIYGPNGISGIDALHAPKMSKPFLLFWQLLSCCFGLKNGHKINATFYLRRGKTTQGITNVHITILKEWNLEVS